MSVPGAVVIGGGAAGLNAAYHLGLAGIETVVLERGRVGETWRTQRWDSFALNTPAWYSRLPGDAEPAGDAAEAFYSAAEFTERLEACVGRNGLDVRTGATVTRVEPAGRPGAGRHGDGLLVRVDDVDGSHELRTRSVVVASGNMNVPRVPSIAAALPAGIRQLTAGDYRRASDLPPGAVLVVGGAQSGVQLAEDLVAGGRSVYLCTSAVGRVRRRYRGRDMFAWLEPAGFFDRTVAQLPDPAMVRWPNPQTSGVGPRGHTVSLQSLARLGVTLLGRPTAVVGDRIVLDETVGSNVAFGDRISAELKVLADRTIDAVGGTWPAAEPDPADDRHPDPAAIHSPGDLDLERAGIGSVVWATGFGGDFSYLPPEVLDDRGQPIHEQGVLPLPGLFVLGFPWLTKRKSGIIAGVGEDAERIARLIARRLASDVPD